MEKIGEIKARFAEAEERLKKASMRTEAESAAGLLENLNKPIGKTQEAVCRR